MTSQSLLTPEPPKASFLTYFLVNELLATTVSYFVVGALFMDFSVLFFFLGFHRILLGNTDTLLHTVQSSWYYTFLIACMSLVWAGSKVILKGPART